MRESRFCSTPAFLFWARVSDARIDLYFYRSFQPPFLINF
nr:MAG TPA: hypothetical protein [Caudoviricetes sp.]